MKPIEGETLATTWFAAVRHLSADEVSGKEFNMVLEIAKPAARTPSDREIIKAVDTLLRKHGKHPVHTVAETIFPFSLYLREGVKGVYQTYPNDVFPVIKKSRDVSWGTYAERLVRWPVPGKAPVNQLDRAIRRVRTSQKAGKKPYAASYEFSVATSDDREPQTARSHTTDADLDLYNPGRDVGRPYGGPCLSHVSVKVRDGKSLILTALYRSHYYIEKALGNLLGLSHLQAFLCNETGLEPGPLVCMSTYAYLDPGDGKGGVWGQKGIATLLESLGRPATSKRGKP